MPFSSLKQMDSKMQGLGQSAVRGCEDVMTCLDVFHDMFVYQSGLGRVDTENETSPHV